MVICKKCSGLYNSDDEPTGFYVRDYPDDYICEHCVEENELEYDV